MSDAGYISISEQAIKGITDDTTRRFILRILACGYNPITSELFFGAEHTEFLLRALENSCKASPNHKETKSVEWVGMQDEEVRGFAAQLGLTPKDIEMGSLLDEEITAFQEAEGLSFDETSKLLATVLKCRQRFAEFIDSLKTDLGAEVPE